ncbi:Stk1 family PASTA domain-containing Ser/Thr kinase [Priestia abyssalis]|uniref:Stk1 family PASTA domain-containing Ser/Thr kinase n=1 Tax=Priestia abyssalis TaxID=1221450 RepID=UPI000994E60F|nr:Stk1 family PASTA domain-containing Ser/Thr kinase [Priestia abyssalis]
MLVGRRLNDRYKVLKVIGGGGMANVYLARDMILDRDVAIKVLRLDFANDESFIKRFHREAQSATSIAHPNIVSIYDVGEQEEIYYIVMEYVPGQTLKQYIQQHAPIPVEKAVDIMTQITSAIAHAHQFGIIHRDLKPQNILIDDNGTVKVTDFGIAVALSSTTITQTNSVLGSVHYLSPEQARGGLANKKSDIYSLGIVLFELLTGRVPFSGESAVSIALKHLQTETPSPKRWNPSIPQSLENVVLKATAKDSFYRYDSVEEMQNALETSMNPERLNEKKFEVPDDEEATKAIPVITDDYIDSPTDETIVRSFSKPVVVPDEEPVQKAQKAPKKKKRKKNKWMVSLLILFLVLAGAGVIAVTVLPSFFLPKDVTIPNLRDEDYEEAVTKLVSLGFVVDDPVLKSDEEIEEGKVIQTVPGSGEVVKEGTEVKIYQSTGKEKIAFEDYTGKDVSTVKKMLEQKGYRFVNTVNVDSEEPAGTIINQTPIEGAENVPEETDVTFWVSKGPPSVQLKDLSGWTEKSVRDYVSDYDIVVKVKEEHSDTDKGFVIRQDPAPETTIEKGSELTITLSLGPEPKPPNNVNVEVTIPYEPAEPGVPQQVQIFVDDLGRDYPVPIEDFTLTETIKRQIQLIIPYNETAKYKIVRDNQVIEETEVPYSQQ